MSRVTIKELKEQLKQAKNVVEIHRDDLFKLQKELDETRKGLNVVSSSEFKGVIAELETSKRINEMLKSNHAHDIKKYELIIKNLKEENESLKNNSTVIKTEHNIRNAGRKEFKDYSTVKRIFELYSNGESLQKIADKLNDEGIKTNRGGAWAKSSIRFILLNNSYVANGVIDADTFNIISERLKSNRKAKEKLMTEEEYNRHREQVNSLRKGLRDLGHTHSGTKDLPSYEEYLKSFKDK